MKSLTMCVTAGIFLTIWDEFENEKISSAAFEWLEGILKKLPKYTGENGNDNYYTVPNEEPAGENILSENVVDTTEVAQ